MYTLGIALKNTPFEGQYSIDQAIATAIEKHILKEPSKYGPRPGDIAIVPTESCPEGGHAVMITENGGTIQNGSSHNGIWESDFSPQEMFGGVKYYISMQGFLKLKNPNASESIFFSFPSDSTADGKEKMFFE